MFQLEDLCSQLGGQAVHLVVSECIISEFIKQTLLSKLNSKHQQTHLERVGNP